MRRTLMLMALAAVSAPVWGAEWESTMNNALYGVTFADYAVGENLSNKGVVPAGSGSWTTIPATAMTGAGSFGDRKELAMEYVTLSDIVFGVATPGREEKSAKAFRVATWVTAYEAEPPDLEKKDKFAFAIATRKGKQTFAGWSAGDSQWKELHLKSGKLKPESGAWYDLSVWLVTGVGDRVRVQYRLKVGKDEYEPLLTEDDSAWLEVGNFPMIDSVVRNVAIRGEGAFDMMAGKELPSAGVSVHFN